MRRGSAPMTYARRRRFGICASLAGSSCLSGLLSIGDMDGHRQHFGRRAASLVATQSGGTVHYGWFTRTMGRSRLGSGTSGRLRLLRLLIHAYSATSSAANGKVWPGAKGRLGLHLVRAACRRVVERSLVDLVRTMDGRRGTETPSCRYWELEYSLLEKWSCQPKTTRLATISSTVRIGNRDVGMLSLIGIKAGEA